MGEGRNLFNDFAVLFLESNFDLDINLDSVCLPEPEETFDGTTCFATGWGKDKFGSAGQYQVVLKEIDLPVVSNDVCQDSLRTTRLGKRFKLHPSFICAGGIPGKDTCKGDGGSPLVCPSKYDPNTYVQAGIVAWGVGCGEDGTPGVYASVNKAVCWIDYVMSCYYGQATGDFSSYWGFSADSCQSWLDTKLSQLYSQKETGLWDSTLSAQCLGSKGQLLPLWMSLTWAGMTMSSSSSTVNPMKNCHTEQSLRTSFQSSTNAVIYKKIC